MCNTEKRGLNKREQRFLDIVEAKFKELYDFSEFIYEGYNVKGKVRCQKHGEFWQQPQYLIRGNGCPDCGKESFVKNRTHNTDTFISKAKLVHGDKYDYSKVDYVNAITKVCIICKDHGEFWQTPNSHLRGRGCMDCAIELRAKIHRQGRDMFISKAKAVHKGKYDYSLVVYVNNRTEVCIICPKHGIFWQRPDAHLLGKGCSKCSLNVSKPEIEIQEFVKNLGYITKNNSKNIIPPKELDIYIPELRKAIEFNGEYWHYDQRNKNCKPKGYHAMKSNLCRDKGIKLLHIREDLWLKDKEKMKEVIFRFLNN